MRSITLIVLSILLVSVKLDPIPAVENEEKVPDSDIQKWEDYDEAEYSDGIVTKAELRVAISVGERATSSCQNCDFEYKLEGRTSNGEKIVVGGSYYNNPNTKSGIVKLQMNIVSDVTYIDYGFDRYNKMQIYVENQQSRQFYFQITPPDQVDARIMKIGQLNATSILVVGPSRSNRDF